MLRMLKERETELVQLSTAILNMEAYQNAKLNRLQRPLLGHLLRRARDRSLRIEEVIAILTQRIEEMA